MSIRVKCKVKGLFGDTGCGKIMKGEISENGEWRIKCNTQIYIFICCLAKQSLAAKEKRIKERIL